jgi:hypothetical protein
MSIKNHYALYKEFKKRVLAYPNTLLQISSQFSPSYSSSPSSSPCSPSSNMETFYKRSILYLISNMMSVYHHNEEESIEFDRNEILIYWPYEQDEFTTKTCIIDYNFERTNVNNVFFIVNRDHLTQQLIKTPDGVQFSSCSCNNHKKDLDFVSSEFIPYQFVTTLYHYFLNHPHYEPLLASISSYAYLIPSSPPPPNISFIIEKIMEKYFSSNRLKDSSSSKVQPKMLLKGMNLSSHVIQKKDKLFDTTKVFIHSFIH